MPDREFEWDGAKAAANFGKHGVDFATATEVFADPFAIEALDPDSDMHGEARFRITGRGGGVLPTVVYTDRHERIRIISARRATRQEHDNDHIANSQP